MTVRHRYDTTRTSPYGYYVTCSCGWVSTEYRPTARGAWGDWNDHASGSRREHDVERAHELALVVDRAIETARACGFVLYPWQVTALAFALAAQGRTGTRRAPWPLELSEPSS